MLLLLLLGIRIGRDVAGTIVQGIIVAGRCRRGQRMQTAHRLPLAHQTFPVWMLIIQRRRRVAAALVTTRSWCRRRRHIQTIDVPAAIVIVVDVARRRLARVERDQSGKRQLTLIRTAR